MRWVVFSGGVPVGSERAFRFGVVARAAASRAEWNAKAHAAEERGFSVLLAPDHFGAQIAPVPALLLAAEVTRTLRVGSLVFDNDFRHPALLAKEAATLDLLTEGRFELGIGAGWDTAEYARAGLAFVAPRTRLARLAEAVHIVKGLFGDEPLTFAGEFYSIADLSGYPRPVQRPRPPILIGGGRRGLLSLAAREADIVGIAPRFSNGVGQPESLTAEAADEQMRWIREAAAARFDALELNILIQRVIVTDDRARAAEELAGAWGMSPEQTFSSPHALLGTAGQIAETLRERRERYGISYISVFEQHAGDFAAVIPLLAGS